MNKKGLNYPWDDAPAEGEAIEVAQGILWFRLPLPMKLDHVNCYALDDGDGWTIVDTGMNSRRSRAIWQSLIDGPLSGRKLNQIVVTHHHPDHFGCAGWLMDEFDAKLVTTRTSWLMARMLTLDVQETPAAETLQFWRAAGMRADILEKRTQERPFNFADMVAPIPLGYTRIAEGDVLTAGGREWTVRIGNGHAPEHATLWSGDLVLGGDQLLPSISPNLGVYATEPDADPVTEWLEACERLATHATDSQLVLPGHKLPFTGLPKRLQQLIENHHGALRRLREYLAEPRTAVECFVPLFKREIGDGEYGLALVEAVAHLNHLLALGQASREKRAGGAWLWTAKT